MTTPTAHRILYTLMAISLLFVALVGLQGCAYVTIEGPEYKARLITFTPTGTATGFEAVLTNKGRVSLNREQGGAEGLVEAAVDAATGL